MTRRTGSCAFAAALLFVSGCSPAGRAPAGDIAFSLEPARASQSGIRSRQRCVLGRAGRGSDPHRDRAGRRCAGGGSNGRERHFPRVSPSVSVRSRPAVRRQTRHEPLARAANSGRLGGRRQSAGARGNRARDRFRHPAVTGSMAREHTPLLRPFFRADVAGQRCGQGPPRRRGRRGHPQRIAAAQRGSVERGPNAIHRVVRSGAREARHPRPTARWDGRS